jgi:HAD superfamily hydrolase (TIGR01549 family)
MAQNSVIVSLDFGGTLDGTAIPPKVHRWSYYHRAGYEFTDEVLVQAHIYVREQILAIPERKSWGLAETTKQWFVREAEYLGLDTKLAEKWAEEFEHVKRSRIEKARPLLFNLASCYELALISNNIGNLERILIEIGVRDAFRVIVDSSECGFRKPDPRIFYECQRRLYGISANHCWYLGDNFENDVIGSLSAGWNAAWLVRQTPHRDIPKNVLVVTSLEEFRDKLHNRYHKQE